MVDKEIIIDGERIGLGTGVKGSVEINRTSTQTFDGAKNSGLSNVPHTLEISKLVCDNIEDYRRLMNLMKEMRSEPKTITIKEIIRSNEHGVFTVTKHYINCLVDGDEYEMSAEDITALTLKFGAEDMTEDLTEGAE